jgi:hypothetical protein
MVGELGKAYRLYEETLGAQWQIGAVGLDHGSAAVAGHRLRRTHAQ